jgi:membrane protein DedA with SNARE-associated domain
MNNRPQSDFEKAAPAQSEGYFVGEFWSFLKHNKKWWLGPIVIVLLLLGLLLVLSSTAAAPFIYTLF